MYITTTKTSANVEKAGSKISSKAAAITTRPSTRMSTFDTTTQGSARVSYNNTSLPGSRHINPSNLSTSLMNITNSAETINMSKTSKKGAYMKQT